MVKWEKALTNPYNPDNKKSKPYVSKKMHVTPPPVNELHLEDHERAHTGKANSKIDHGQGKMKTSAPQHDEHVQDAYEDMQNKWNKDMGSSQYHRLRSGLDKGLD